MECQSNGTECQDNIVYRTYLLIIMTRQEMQKLLDELDHKHVETRDKKIKEEPCDAQLKAADDPAAVASNGHR